MDEAAFTRAILDAPQDDATRLVFADWLEERGDVRGEFLRVLVRLDALSEKGAPEDARARLRWIRERAALRERYRQLREVVPLDWAMRVTRSRIDCERRHDGPACPGRWELLRETDDPRVRRCGQCGCSVWFCDTSGEIAEAIHTRHPFVVSPGLGRER